ncbi:uncharacterized protein LOC115883346 [Sitophilus oryzae]|uniref:Uncharacterized protein LOC115883346 n=1 Tax=Sitophilus oryzae TaxID=7048 RepID=A0A6J2Y3P3_SITOR|nr:uncharacterized protein LOC115883346 [Sitophilus oryzae]
MNIFTTSSIFIFLALEGECNFREEFFKNENIKRCATIAKYHTLSFNATLLERENKYACIFKCLMEIQYFEENDGEFYVKRNMDQLDTIHNIDICFNGHNKPITCSDIENIFDCIELIIIEETKI